MRRGPSHWHAPLHAAELHATELHAAEPEPDRPQDAEGGLATIWGDDEGPTNEVLGEEQAERLLRLVPWEHVLNGAPRGVNPTEETATLSAAQRDLLTMVRENVGFGCGRLIGGRLGGR